MGQSGVGPAQSLQLLREPERRLLGSAVSCCPLLDSQRQHLEINAQSPLVSGL